MAAETAVIPSFGVPGKDAYDQEIKELKCIYIETVATADNGDTYAIDLANYGMTTFLGAISHTHSTTDSIVITEESTTSVTGTVLTLTIGGGTVNKKRAIVVFGV